MRMSLKVKGEEIIHHWFFWLILITGIAILIRSIPAYVNAAWGNDFGIYYGLTNSFVKTKSIINPYNGWGDSYQYFPVLYMITGIAHWITGIHVFSLLPKIAPIFGGLTVFILYFIAYELFHDRFIALLSSTLLSVATFHVYQTSHAAPLTIGHFFMMLSIYFFIRYREDRKMIIPLIFSTVLLILSHHFTTYFYLISITFILFFDLLYYKDLKQYHMLLYIIFASSLAFSYWAFIATPVFYNFMSNKLIGSSIGVIALYYIFLFLGYISVILIRSRKISIPKFPIVLSIGEKTILFFIIIMSIIFLVSPYKIPGVYVRLNLIAIILSIPMVFLVSIAAAGLPLLKEKGVVLEGWFLAILLSFFNSFFFNFLPDRHLEYLIVPICIIAAFTIRESIATIDMGLLKSRFSHPFHIVSRRRLVVLSIIGMICIVNMMAAYPTVEVLDAIDERVTTPCVNALNWMKGNLSKGVVASDHRLSMLLWADGFPITYDNTNLTWTAENISGCAEELLDLNISYIFIDDIMRYNVLNVGVGVYIHMTNESYEKFSKPPFRLIYRNSTVNNLGEEIHWAEVYAVNLSYISKMCLQ